MPDYDYVCSKGGRAFAVFFHSKNLKRSRMSDVPSVRAIRSKSKSLASLQKQARNHSSHVLPERVCYRNYAIRQY